MDREILPGESYGRLTIIRYSHSKPSGRYYLCSCSCGNETTVLRRKLLIGHTKSCGCLKIERYKTGTTTTHGMSKSPECKCWYNIKSRCYNAKSPDYADYGAKGVRVSDEWLSSFATFYSDMGPRPSPDHSLDRINPRGNYCKGNCRWSTASEQAANKRYTRHYTINGQTKCLTEWCAEYDVPYSRVKARMDRHSIPILQALTDPKLEFGKYTTGRKMHVINGESRLLKDWADHFGVSYQRVLYRVRKGWPVEKALSEPPNVNYQRNPHGVKGKP